MSHESSRNGKSIFLVAFIAFVFGMSVGSMRNVNKSFFDVPAMEEYLPTIVSSVSEESFDDISLNQSAPLKEAETAHVLYTLSGNDPGFLSEFSSSLKSVLMNAPLDMDLKIHIMSDSNAHAGLENILFGNVTNLNETISRNQISIRTYNVQSSIRTWRALVHARTSSKVSLGHTMGTYFRLFASDVLPKDIGHIIYMDTDVAVMTNLQDVWSLRDDKVLFQWGKLKCAGFLLINLPKFGAQFWNLIKIIEKINTLKKVSGTHRTNDQLLLQAIQKVHPEKVGSLPKSWDTHVGSGAYNWKTLNRVLEARPRVGFVHLNGGSTSKASAFEEKILVTNENFNRTWLVAQYYDSYPWPWARYNLESQAINGKGVPIDIDYTPI